MRWQCPQCERVATLSASAYKVRCPCGYVGQFREAPAAPPKVISEKVARKTTNRWVRYLSLLSKPEDIGLGATAKRLFAKFGGERFRVWAQRIGLPCGCTEREDEWNRQYPNPNYRGE